MTRREACELVQLTLAGGTPSHDFEPTLDEINYWLDFGVASAAQKNYNESVNIDGIEFVGDAFYVTVKNLTLTEDTDTPYFKVVMPAMPLSLPRGYDVASVNLEMGGGRLSAGGVRVSPQQLDFYKGLPTPPNAFFFWFEDGKLFIESFVELTGKKVRVRMASSSVDKSMSATLNVPLDQMPYVMEYMEKKFDRKRPIDVSNDGKNIA